MSDFDYATVPLDASGDQIRLARFCTRDSIDEEIRCHIEVFSLKDAPRYASISYVWGDSGMRLPVRCNNIGYVYITKNLHEAFSYFGYDKSSPFLENRHEWIWADAININQLDLRERESQVLIMRRIYAQAEHTLIWLGMPNAQARYAFHWMSEFGAVSEKCKAGKCNKMVHEMTPQERHSYGVTDSWIASGPGSVTDVSWFFRNPWFTRVWVIQELAVSQRPILVCGPMQMEWNTFDDGVRFTWRIPPLRCRLNDRICDLLVIRDAIQDGTYLSLLGLLVLTRTYESTDPRDKVYAVLGLSNDSMQGDLDLQPDYSMSAEEVYRKTATALMNGYPRLDVLNVCRRSKDATSLKIPSWVPDWRADHQTKEQYTTLFLSFAAILVMNNFEVPYTATPCNQFKNPHSSDEKSCSLSGFAVSSIRELGGIYELPHMTYESSWVQHKVAVKRYMVMTQWAQLRKIKSRGRYGLTNEKMLDAWGNTITAGALGQEIPYNNANTMQGFMQWYGVFFRQIPLLPPARLLTWLRMHLYMLRIHLQRLQLSVDYREFLNQLDRSAGHRLFRTREGYMGLAPAAAQQDDAIFLIKGCRTPLILRNTDIENEWELVGECYLHGAMKGELYDEERCHSVCLV